MGNFWQDLRETAHRVDPLGAKLVDNMIRTDSRVVAEVSRGHDRVFGGSDRQTGLGRGIRDESRRNIKDPSRAVGRAAATLALMYGAYAYSGGAAAGAGAAEAGAAGASAGYGAGAFEGYAGTQAASGSLAAGAGTGTLGSGTAAGYGFSSELAAGELLGSAALGGATGAAVSGGTQTAATTPANTATPNPTTPSPYRRAAESIGTGIATNYVTSLLAPKPDTPQVEPVTPMPDPEAQAAARKRKAALRARQGRVSSILTAPGGY
jgi:hypothetical protein